MIQNIYLISDIFVFFIGSIFGSFFNVCIYRIPIEEGIVKGRSHCTSCNRTLKGYELVPIFSWIFLRGKCMKCKRKISVQYPLIELVTGITYLLIFLRFGFSLETIKYMFLMSIIIISGAIDFKTKEVYFKVSLVGIVGGIIFSFISMYEGNNILNILISIGIPIFIIGVIYIISKRFDGFGLGDLEIFIMISLYMTPEKVLVSIFISIILGGIFSMGYILKGIRGKRIPFVPFIAIGTFISLMYGNILLGWYLALF
ncbi:MAG: prepilin peptidase [Clostridium sp.]|uniref:prepilin peptidase n=1 Tax=Clostridium sp. TaxID=1506 RepID=UPI003F3612E1